VRKRSLTLVSAIFVTMVVSSCVTTEEPQIVMSTKGAVELRAIQSRKFDTPDDKKVYRAIIAVMLDLG